MWTASSEPALDRLRVDGQPVGNGLKAKSRRCQGCVQAIVLMDVRMDRMDGPAAARLIHRELPRTRVVFFTATTPVEQRWFQNTGAVAVLGKGTPPDLLITTIRSAADDSQISDPS